MLPDRQILAEQAHRRETRLYIILPLVVGIVVVVAGGVIALLLPQRLQVSLIADLLVTVLLLCPSVLCLFAVAIGFVAAAAAMNKAHTGAGKLLGRAEGLSARMLDTTNRATETINQKTINLSVKLAFLEKLLDVYERPALPPKDERK
ncbi:MAG: hypothetical protein HZC41_14185 [Chloroflexi bacterium]|nr:hypothetical protein [Chloroflexota bacterium]